MDIPNVPVKPLDDTSKNNKLNKCLMFIKLVCKPCIYKKLYNFLVKYQITKIFLHFLFFHLKK